MHFLSITLYERGLKNVFLHSHSEIEDYLRTAKVEVVNEEAKARKKRSVEPYDYYALHKPSRFLEQHNVGYRIKVPTTGACTSENHFARHTNHSNVDFK